MKRVLILDLDNTIYPVSSISNNLFGQLFKLVEEHLDGDTAARANHEFTRRPYQHVANKNTSWSNRRRPGIDGHERID